MDTKQISYLFFDYDNTVRVNAEISQATRDAMQAAKERGCKLILCTGRARGAKVAEMDIIPWDGMIFGGCDILLNSTLVEEKAVDAEDVAIWVTYSMKTHRFLAYEGQKKVLFLRFDEHEEDYTQGEIDEQIKTVLEQMQDNPATKFSVMGTDFATAKLPESRMNPIVHASYLEVFGAGCDKGSAILRFCEVIDADIEECACFGDSMNDYSMFKTCPVSVCMKWSPEKLRKAATYCATTDEGVAEGIEWILSQNEKESNK